MYFALVNMFESNYTKSIHIVWLVRRFAAIYALHILRKILLKVKLIIGLGYVHNV